MRLDQGSNNMDQNFDRMSEDNKAEVQRLIARANATSVGSPMLMSPSNMLMSPQRTQQNVSANFSFLPFYFQTYCQCLSLLPVIYIKTQASAMKFLIKFVCK